jgi:hypothetical protein
MELEGLTYSHLRRGYSTLVKKLGTWLILELEGQIVQQLLR